MDGQQVYERYQAGEGNFEGVDLHGAYLHAFDLRKASLRHADLSGADLSDANLCRTDLKGANLRGANLFDEIDDDPERGIMAFYQATVKLCTWIAAGGWVLTVALRVRKPSAACLRRRPLTSQSTLLQLWAEAEIWLTYSLACGSIFGARLNPWRPYHSTELGCIGQ